MSVAALALVVAAGMGSCSGSAAVQSGKALGQRFVALADDADGFAQIFERAPTAHEAAGLPKLFTQAEGLGLEVLKSVDDVSQAARVSEALADTTSTFMTLVGHNSDGSFRFTDGSELALSGMAIPEGKIVAVISCESLDFVPAGVAGVPDELTYQVAFRTEQLFTEAWTESVRTDAAAAQELLYSAFQTAAREVVAKRFAVAGLVIVPTGAVGIAIAEVSR